MNEHESPAAVDRYAPPWRLVVADGSGNGYACQHAAGGTPHCRYTPVSPEQSSTGQYSGGDPWQVELAPGQVETLWRAVEAAAADTARHTDARAKTTVAVEASGPVTGAFILHADGGAALIQALVALRPASAATPSLH